MGNRLTADDILDMHDSGKVIEAYRALRIADRSLKSIDACRAVINQLRKDRAIAETDAPTPLDAMVAAAAEEVTSFDQINMLVLKLLADAKAKVGNVENAESVCRNVALRVVEAYVEGFEANVNVTKAVQSLLIEVRQTAFSDDGSVVEGPLSRVIAAASGTFKVDGCDSLLNDLIRTK